MLQKKKKLKKKKKKKENKKRGKRKKIRFKDTMKAYFCYHYTLF